MFGRFGIRFQNLTVDFAPPILAGTTSRNGVRFLHLAAGHLRMTTEFNTKKRSGKKLSRHGAADVGHLRGGRAKVEFEPAKESSASSLAPKNGAVTFAFVRVVIDTNVLLSALRSKRGASFRFVQKLGSSQYHSQHTGLCGSGRSRYSSGDVSPTCSRRIVGPYGRA